eukprot:5749661-Karenia_brevis.AAC.1
MTTLVQKWSKNDDRRLSRIFCYLKTSMEYMLCGHVGDPPEKLFLRCFTDADFAGGNSDVRSPSGGFLALAGPNTLFPLA